MLRKKLYVYGDERLEVPSHLHFGKEMLDRMIKYQDHPALINADNGETVTFGQLAQKTVDIALSLARIGVVKGDVVSICSEKRMEVIPTVLGVICVGGTFAPMDITYGTVPLAHRVNIAKPKVMFISPDAYDLHKPCFDSVGCVETYVVYGDENKDGGVSFREFLTETADVADFIPTPLDGWKDLTLILFSSGTTGLPKGVPWTHLGILINSESCTNKSFKYSSILITREWYFSYGLFITISCLKKGTTCVFSPRNEESDCLQAIQKYKVVDFETREPLGPNQRGEICFKSPTLTPGYIGVDNTDHLDSEGFYKTGDVGYYDDDRYFYIINRVKELIKYKDISIVPAELEAILVREPRVREAGVGAVGELVAALVVLQPGARAAPQELLDYLQSNISFRMRIEGGVHVVKSLPRGGGDKLDRKTLHDMLLHVLEGNNQ